jgi:hypothetical protein
VDIGNYQPKRSIYKDYQKDLRRGYDIPHFSEEFTLCRFLPKDCRDILSVKDHIGINAFKISVLCLFLPEMSTLSSCLKMQLTNGKS